MIKLSKNKVCKIAGVATSLPIFVDPSSPIILANSALAEGGTALPVSIFILPFLICIFIKDITLRRFDGIIYPFLCLLIFFAFSSVLSIGSLAKSSSAILYSIQWNMTFFWLVFFIAIRNDHDRIKSFLVGFSIGSVIASTYIFLCGVLEISMYGALMDFGRMTQNIVIPGQYQLYVYIPTVLAFSCLTFNWLWRADIINVSYKVVIIHNLITLIALSFTGAREGIVVYIVGCVLFFASKNKNRLQLFFAMLPILFLLLWALSGPALELFKDSDMRLLSKMASLSDSSSMYGARDVMIGHYLLILEKELLFGLGMLPPNISLSYLGIDAPSAHNFYVDALAWSGLVGGGLIILFSLSLVSQSLYNLFYRDYRIENNHLMIGSAFLIIIFLFVSSNINVPFRQPVTAPIFALLIALLYGSKHER